MNQLIRKKSDQKFSFQQHNLMMTSNSNNNNNNKFVQHLTYAIVNHSNANNSYSIRQFPPSSPLALPYVAAPLTPPPYADAASSAAGAADALPEQLPLPIVIILSVPALLIILLTVFGNLLVLFFKARVGRTNTTLLVWNLGLTDFMVGVLVLPMGAYYLLNRRWIFGQMLCRIWVGADVTFCTCSVVTICIISVDRYLAVTRPLRYKSVVTKLKVIVVIILIWSFSLGILLATVRWESHQDTMENKTCYVGDEIRYLAHSVVFAFFLPASVTLTLYWRIYSLARNRQRALDRGFLMILGHNMNFLTNTLSQTTALRVHIGKNNGMVEHQRRVLRTHERIAKTLGVVSCSFLFCWLPFFTLYLLNYQCKSCVPSLAIDIASWLGYCNSMLNPIIYSFTVKEFKRSAFRAVLPIWRCVHGWCPRVVRKPPDAKSVHRIGRKRQQISATQQQQQHHQRQQRGVPPLSTMCNNNNNATGLTGAAATTIGADGRKRRIPSRERMSRARTGAIASLMVNTNCSIMQNAMTVELVNKNNSKKRKANAVKKNVAADGGDYGKKSESDDDSEKAAMIKHDDDADKKCEHEQLLLINSNNMSMSSNHPKIMLNGTVEKIAIVAAASRRTTGAAAADQSKRSLIMFGENLNKMAQKLGSATRRRSSLDDAQDMRKYSDSGSDLFSRSGLVTTTLLLATSKSMCDDDELLLNNNNNDVAIMYNNNRQNHDDDNDDDQRRHSKKRSASTTEGGGGERTGSLPTSPSFSSSLDSDLTAEHSQYSVRMPCKLPVKKWKREEQRQQQRRRHSMHGIPSKGSGNNGTGGGGVDKHNKVMAMASVKSGATTDEGVRVQLQHQQQRQSRKKLALFSAFKRKRNANEEAVGSDETAAACSPPTGTTTTSQNNVGLWWQRATRAMSSRRRRILMRGLSASNSLGSIGAGGGAAAAGADRKKKRKKQRSKEEEEEEREGEKRVNAEKETTTKRELARQREKGRGESVTMRTTTTTTTTTERGGGESGSDRQLEKEARECDEGRGEERRREKRAAAAETVQIIYVTDETPL